jgi:hypothetical protein
VNEIFWRVAVKRIFEISLDHDLDVVTEFLYGRVDYSLCFSHEVSLEVAQEHFCHCAIEDAVVEDWVAARSK